MDYTSSSSREVFEDDMNLVLMMMENETGTPSIPRNIVHVRRDRGHEMVHDMLNGPNTICVEMCRMNKFSFLKLCQIFRDRDLLEDTRHISVEEQMRMFLQILAHNHNNRAMGHHMQHSGETISRHFNKILKVMAIWSVDMLKPKCSFQQVPRFIRSKPKYYPYFKDCIGAIDGTHIRAIVEPSRQQAFRGKEKICTQNVMAACDFNMRFIFSVAGWEGSAHDAKVFSHAVYDPRMNFPMPPPGKFYVVDAGYPNRTGFLAPYRNTRYHLPEFNRRIPSGRKEKFNHVHSSLRNVIERTFGVWKKRWAILANMAPYTFRKQVKIVIASMALHNFIREEQVFFQNLDLRDALFMEYADDNLILPVQPQHVSVDGEDEEELGDDDAMLTLRDQIRDAIGAALNIPATT